MENIPCKKLFVIIVLLGLFFITACSKTEPTGQVTADKPLRIGAVLSLTGVGASIGETLKQGLEWKAQELTEEGRSVEIYIEDSQSDPKQAVNAFSKLIELNNVNIVFTILSSVCMNLKPLAEDKEVLLWADCAHPGVTENSTYVLRHSNLANLDALKIAEHIEKNNYKSIGVIYSQDDYGVVSNKVIVDALVTFGIKTFSEGVDPKASDFKTEITKLKMDNPEAIVLFSSGPSTGIVLKQLRELDYKGSIYSSIVLILTPGAVDIAKDYLAGTYYATFVYQSSKFKTDYKEKFGKEPNVMGFLGYTDMELLMYAIKETGSTKPDEILKFIKNLKEFQGKYEKVKINPNGDIVLETEIRKWSEE